MKRVVSWSDSQRPVHYVQTDVSHPLMQNVFWDLLFHMPRPYDASGRIPVHEFTVDANLTYVPTRYGLNWVWPRSADTPITIGNSDDAEPYNLIQKSSGFWTFAFAFQFDGTNDSNEFTLQNNSLSVGSFTNLGFSNSDVEDGNLHTLVVRRNGTISAEAYLDGIQLATDTPTAGENVNCLIRYDSNVNAWEIFIGDSGGANLTDYEIGASPQTTNDPWDGPIFRAIASTRAWSSTDALAFHANPWAGLRPSQYYIPINEVAAGGGGTILPFMIHYHGG